MRRKIGYAIGIILLLFLSGSFYYIRKFNRAFFKEKSDYLTYTFQSKPIEFRWASNTIGSKAFYEPQAAIIFPVEILGLNHRFQMQFDTGSPHSYIYGKDLESLIQLGLEISVVEKGDERFVKQIDFNLGGNQIKASMVKVLDNYGNTFSKNDTIPVIRIGTIGSDFLKNRIVAIDFKNEILELFNKRPKWMSSLPKFQSFDFSGRRIMLPVGIDGKYYELLYDSGCSAFGLITTKNRFNRYADPDAETVSYDAKSWESKIAINSKTSSQLFTIGGTKLNLKRVSYVDMYTALQPLVTPFTRIGGWLGNQPFNESQLILDTVNEEFLVITK